MPISYILRPIVEIFTNRFFNLKQFKDVSIDVNNFSKNLQTASDNYCNDYLKPNNFVKTCTPPTSDPVYTPPKVIKVESGDWVVLKNSASGNCVTDMRFGIVVTNSCYQDHIDQQWKFVFVNNVFKVIARGSGLVMDIDHGWTDNGNNLLTFNSNDGKNQRWTVMTDSGFYKFQNQNSGKCLDVNNGDTAEYTQIKQYDCTTGKASQQFTALEALANPVSDGKWVTIQNVAAGNCLQETGKGNDLLMKTCNSKNNSQLFKFTDVGYGYKVYVKSSGLVWDVDHVSHDNGARTNTWPAGNNSDNQVWSVSLEAGKYRFTVRHSGKCLDVAGGSRNQNTNVNQYDCITGNNNQLYTLNVVG